MFSPEMLQQAQQMMANMSPEQMKQMTEMASKMDPSVLRSMGSQVAGSNLPSEEDMKKAQAQMAQMNPEELKTQMNQAQQQMKGKQSYLYTAAIQLKTEGNKLVGEKKYEEAKAKYQKAIDNVKEGGGAQDMLWNSCLLNLSLCQLKLEEYTDCIETCDTYLHAADINSKLSVKALFRRGSAMVHLPGETNLRDGYVYLKRANALSPDDDAIEEEYLKYRKIAEDARLDIDDLDSEAVAANESGEKPPAPAGMASSSSQPKDEDRPKIEELDDPEIEKPTSATPSKPSVPTASAQPAAAIPSKASPKITPSPEQVKEILNDTSTLKNATQMMSGLSPEQLASMTGQSKEQCEQMKDAMKQFNENPDMMKQVEEMMKNMKPEDMENMMKMQGRMAGGHGAAGSSSQGGSGKQADMNDMMKNPEMIKTAESMMKNMTPDMVKDAMKTQGMELSDKQAKLMTKAIPVLMAMYRYFLHLKNAISFLFTKPGRLVLALIILIVGIYTQYFAY